MVRARWKRGFSLAIALLDAIEGCQVVKAQGDIGVGGLECLLADGQGPLIGRLRPSIVREY
jgi:hypothetical protein